jgi:hypothetical protein
MPFKSSFFATLGRETSADGGMPDVAAVFVDTLTLADRQKRRRHRGV